MTKKHTFESINKYFEDQSCKLLETEYINNKTKMKYRCKCGNDSEITYGNFLSGKRCKKCAGNEKLTYEFVHNYFKEDKCELLESEYINSNTKMKYKCKCGNESSISWDSFISGSRCKKCSGSETFTYEYVKNFFKERNCELLETEYKNISTPMKYKCECGCGNVSKICYSSLKSGSRCKKCFNLKSRKLFDDVKDYFTEQNCELLETEYISNNTKMKYKCNCGNTSKITLNSFKKGTRCTMCGYEKHSKSLKIYKDYKFPSGNIVKIQGYEYLALDELIKVYKEDDIITNKRDMPKINYNFENKQKRYYPDIWIKSINQIIEVKSDWTYNKDLAKNKLKEIATKELNFNFEFWIYKPEKKKFFSKIIN